MVLGLQIYLTLGAASAPRRSWAGRRPLAHPRARPVLAALMVTGTRGSALTAELGIMRITEQIDALTVMALSPMRYLVAPSILAGLVTFPLMTALFDVVGIFGGYLVGVKLWACRRAPTSARCRRSSISATSWLASGSRSRSES
jgi:phospholipid/cholesterol/gamma-HCH transport system permease protein